MPSCLSHLFPSSSSRPPPTPLPPNTTALIINAHTILGTSIATTLALLGCSRLILISPLPHMSPSTSNHGSFPTSSSAARAAILAASLASPYANRDVIVDEWTADLTDSNSLKGICARVEKDVGRVDYVVGVLDYDDNKEGGLSEVAKGLFLLVVGMTPVLRRGNGIARVTIIVSHASWSHGKPIPSRDKRTQAFLAWRLARALPVPAQPHLRPIVLAAVDPGPCLAQDYERRLDRRYSWWRRPLARTWLRIVGRTADVAALDIVVEMVMCNDDGLQHLSTGIMEEDDGRIKPVTTTAATTAATTTTTTTSSISEKTEGTTPKRTNLATTTNMRGGAQDKPPAQAHVIAWAEFVHALEAIYPGAVTASLDIDEMMLR